MVECERINQIYHDPMKYNEYRDNMRALFEKKVSLREQFITEWARIEKLPSIEAAFKFYHETNSMDLKTNTNENIAKSFQYCYTALQLTEETSKLLSILSPLKDIKETTINNLPEEHKNLILTIIYKVGEKIKSSSKQLGLNLNGMVTIG